jgi:hypothetical protein
MYDWMYFFIFFYIAFWIIINWYGSCPLRGMHTITNISRYFSRCVCAGCISLGIVEHSEGVGVLVLR